MRQLDTPRTLFIPVLLAILVASCSAFRELIKLYELPADARGARDGTGKEEDAEYNEEMGAAGSSPAEAYPAMEKQLLETQDFMQVDASTGATYSLYRFRYVLTLALMQAHL